MQNFVKNISDDVRYVLMDVRFSPNNYYNHAGKIDLSCEDTVSVKEIKKDNFIITLSREIKSSEDFFNIFVMFDIYGRFNEAINDVEDIDEKNFIDSIIKEKNYLLDNCAARISLMISQISAQIGMAIPIVTPASILSNTNEAQ